MITEAHEQKILIPRGITAPQAEQYGVRSIADPSELPPEFQGSRYAVGSGLLFTWNSPMQGVVHQFRPDEPVQNDHGDPVKYAFASGQAMVLNRLRDTGDGPVLVQEGTLQSLAAAIYAHEGWSVYGMSGCWAWRSGETQVAIPDLLVVDGRDVVISLDADSGTNLAVYEAGLGLKDAMIAEGAASVRFLWLSGHGSKAGLDDVLGSRPEDRRADYLARALEHAEEKPAKAKPTKKSRGTGKQIPMASADRPLIMVNDDRRDVINQMTTALQAKWDGDALFGYGGILAWRTDASVTPVTDGVFADLISEAALCVSINAKGDANPAWPDEKSCKAVMSRANRFSPLERISQVPFVRPDGSISQQPGYDESTATYLVLDESVQALQVPDEPTSEDVQSAVKLLCEEWLGDLFDIMPAPEDRANCLAMMLTPLVRGLVPLAPLAVVDGLQAGVGKNLLGDLLAILATGQVARPLPYSREDDENRKVITSEFRSGTELMIFDEAHTIEGAHLARSITSITYSDRILGVSSMIEFPNRVTWVALGNNVSVNGDLSRRVYRIRLAPSMPNPQDRDVSGYRHPDLKGWTKAHRAELIAAALTLVRAWFVDPERQESAAGRRFGSFEPWGGMVGGILDNAGIVGFLGSLVEWRSETDYETRFWSDHLQWLIDTFGEGGQFTVAEVVKAMKRASGGVEHPPRLEDHNANGYNRALGLAYGRVKNRVVNSLQLVKAVEYAGHGNRWMVVDHRPGARPQEAPQDVDAASSCVNTESDQPTTSDPSDRVVGVVQPLPSCGKNDLNRCTSGEATTFSEVTAARVYPTYPNYPSTEGADPLAGLLALTSPVPARICPDCDNEEELTPSGFYFACRSCTPATFLPR